MAYEKNEIGEKIRVGELLLKRAERKLADATNEAWSTADIKRARRKIIEFAQAEQLLSAAKKAILAAFAECNGVQSWSADLLNVNEVTLIRWVRRLTLQGEIDAIREKATKRGAYVRGRPKTKRVGWKRKAGM